MRYYQHDKFEVVSLISLLYIRSLMKKGLIFDMDGVKELVNDLKSCGCLKAVVSGSSKEEIETILDENIGTNNFDLVISGDDLKEGQGKPDPAPFQRALQKMNLKPSEALVVENSPLGVEAANKAGIPYIVTLNNSPLDISSDFGSLKLKEGEQNSRI